MGEIANMQARYIATVFPGRMTGSCGKCFPLTIFASSLPIWATDDIRFVSQPLYLHPHEIKQKLA